MKDAAGHSLLHHAAIQVSAAMVELLLSKRTDFHATNVQSSPPLHEAIIKGNQAAARVLIERGADLDTTRGMAVQVLRFAADCGSLRLFNVVSQKDNTLFASEQANRYGWTPMHYAALNGHASMVAFLAEKGTDVNAKTLSGKSPHNLAEENDQKEVLQALSALKAETGPQRLPELKGSYLGQAAPGNALRLFAPDIISSPNGDDNHDGITFTPDGKKMFFASFRPMGTSSGKENIWYSERIASGWSEPQPVKPEVNAMRLHWSISVSSSGTLYFGGFGQDAFGRQDIYCSRLVNGEYTKPANLGSMINSQGVEHCPYIAPDDSYLIFSRMDDTGAGFYISFKSKDGQWQQPVRSGGELGEVCPAISSDGKYIFFSSDGIYWIKAKFIEELRP